MQQSDWNFDTIAQNEALINEIKGALFEYQVGLNLKQLLPSNSEEGVAKLDVDSDIRTRLIDYENWLRQNDLPLIIFIPKAARQAALQIKEKVSQFQELRFQQISVVGKQASGSGQKELFESDLVLEAHATNFPAEKKYFFIGLKLAKAGSYLNTKSAGVKSFVAQYFAPFAGAPVLQEELNHLLDLSFHKMGQRLYDEALPEHNFQGTFDENWKSSLPELPGQLAPELNAIVQTFYQELIEILYQTLKSFHLENPHLFKQCLFPLLGLGARNLLQANVFVDSRKSEGALGAKSYALNDIRIHDFTDFEEQLSVINFGELRPNMASFEIKLKSWKFQIRIKPMNKFTVPSVKINCSLRID